MKLRWCMLLVGILCLAMLPALAASPDLGTLRYIPPQAPTAELSETTQPGNRVIPLDLWMDATPNMGGINLVEDTLYPTGSSAKYYQGGFHYLWQDNYREFHGWYVDLLTALPELLGPQRSQVRMLRYDDGLFSPELLDRHGLTASTLEAAASLQRDLRTWATRATGETFTEMVQPGPENFYAPGTASAARADQVQLENPAQAQALLAAQQEGLAQPAVSQGGQTQYHRQICHRGKAPGDALAPKEACQLGKGVGRHGGREHRQPVPCQHRVVRCRQINGQHQEYSEEHGGQQGAYRNLPAVAHLLAQHQNTAAGYGAGYACGDGRHALAAAAAKAGHSHQQATCYQQQASGGQENCLFVRGRKAAGEGSLGFVQLPYTKELPHNQQSQAYHQGRARQGGKGQPGFRVKAGHILDQPQEKQHQTGTPQPTGPQQ